MSAPITPTTAPEKGIVNPPAKPLVKKPYPFWLGGEPSLNLVHDAQHDERADIGDFQVSPLLSQHHVHILST